MTRTRLNMGWRKNLVNFGAFISIAIAVYSIVILQNNQVAVACHDFCPLLLTGHMSAF